MYLQEQSILMASHNTQSALSPIHGGQLSYQLYKVTKAIKQRGKPLPFASSASRVSTHFSSEAPSHIVGYTNIYKQESPKENEVEKAPFGTSEDRFTLKLSLQPGPTTYNLSEVGSTKPRAAQGIFDRTSRVQKKKDLSLIGPGSYHVNEEIDKQKLRQKLREKTKEIRQKYSVRQKKIQRSSIGEMPGLSKPEKQSEHHMNLSPKTKDNQKNMASFDRFLLKQNTQKYLNQIGNYQIFKKQTSNEIMPLSPNFSPAFIERKENPFTSYIQVGCSPGPCRYLRKNISKECMGGAKSAFNSKVPRQLYSDKRQPKPKIKLSYIL